MRKKTSTIMAWLLAASVTESAEEGNIEAKEKGELTALCCSLTLFMCDEIFKL